MNYLTNYYKNLSEQLQEKINNLQKMLDEARIRSPAEMRQIGSGEMMDQLSDEPNPRPKINAGYSPWARRAERRETLIRNAASQMGDVAMAGDVETARQFSDVMADINTHSGYGKVAGLRDMTDKDDSGVESQFVNDPGPSNRDVALSKERQITQQALADRAAGKAVNVPADIAAMRKFIAMGRGQYKAPFPQPGPETTGMAPHSSNATY